MIAEKPLTELVEQHLQDLISAVVREGKGIEYKERINITSDDQKRKFLASIASFANASGGDLVFGMKAEEGVPKALVPLQDFEPDRDIRTLRDLVRSHVDPTLFGVEFKEIPISNGMLLVARIPRAWDGAHMVTFNNDNRFYTRDANGRVLMSMPEIRSSFSTMEVRAERIRRLRFERLSAIRSNDLPFRLHEGPKLVVHLFPLRSFEPGFTYDVVPLSNSQQFQPADYNTGWSHYHDLEGVYVADRGDGQAPGYSAALRNGCIELVLRVGRENVIPNPTCENRLFESYNRGIGFLKTLGISGPAIILISLLDIKNHVLWTGHRFMGRPTPIRHKDLILHDILVQNFETPAGIALRPCCDAIWQACGLQRSFNFDETGAWQPQHWS